MHIHTVKPSESVYSISRLYGVTPQSIIDNNELANPDQLAVGQSLVILPFGTIHTVMPKETVYSISRKYNVPVVEILNANPFLGNGSSIMPRDKIIIPKVSKKTTIEVNGYTFPTIDTGVLDRTLPNLTYLSIFSYTVKANGSLNPIDDAEIIARARQQRVAPMMVVSNIEEGKGFSSEIAHSVLNDEQAQNALIANILAVLKDKNYYGVNVDFEYIFPYDRLSYNQFIRKLSATVHREKYILITSLAPKTSANQKGLLYEAHDYPVHGALVDRVILMTYEWGYTSGPPLPVAPLNEVQRVLNYAITAIPKGKILLGIPNYGYDWTLPFVEGSKAETLSNVEAVNRAIEKKATIQFDPKAQTPFYTYVDENRIKHIVWFEDARSIFAKLSIVKQYSLAGVSYWTIGKYFPQNWLILNSMFDVKKLL